MTHIALRTAARHGLALLLALGGTARLAAAQAAAANQTAPWKLNGNGAPGDVTVQQAPDGQLSGSIYRDVLTGYYAPGERIGVWLRGPFGRDRGPAGWPIQAFVGQASPDGMTFSGRLHALNASSAGGSPARNVFAFSAQRAAATAPGSPGVPASPAGPASVAGTHQVTGNGFSGPLQLNQAADGTVTGTIYGESVAGHYAAGTGTIALLRISAPGRILQLWVGSVTPQGMRGEFYALTAGAGASPQRMRYEWSATSSQEAFIGPSGRPALTAGAAVPPALPPQPPGTAVNNAAALTGYEIVAGAEVSVEPLQQAVPTAQCPAGKLLIGGGYDFSGPAEGDYGFETRGVDINTIGGYLEGTARNSNVFVRGTARAYAVCITPPGGMRTIRLQARNAALVQEWKCSDTERVIGGGALSGVDAQLYGNVPLRAGYLDSPTGTGWSVRATRTGAGQAYDIRGFLICAPATAVDGWEHIESAPTGIGARGRTQLQLRCPAGKKMLVAGIVSLFNNSSAAVSDPVVNRLIIASDGSAVAQVVNRNLLGGIIYPQLAGVCARVQ